MRQLIIVVFITVFLTGCAENILKAPCNSSGSNCSPRTKINQWDSNR